MTGKNDTDQFISYFKNDYYTQAGSATPLLIISNAMSGFEMQDELGYSYSHFLYKFYESYGEMSYLHSDLDKIWAIIKEKLENDPTYLDEIKKKYESRFDSHPLIINFDEDQLTKLSDAELLGWLKESVHLASYGTGSAHVIEAIGIPIENDFKSQLELEIPNKELRNKYFAPLTAPTKPSFTAIEEDELIQIAKLPQNKKELALKNHLKKWRWVQNSYAGARVPTLDELNTRLDKIIASPSPKSSSVNISDKEKIVKELNLSTATQKLIELIDFSTVWQDERKARILQGLDYMCAIIAELEKRIKIEFSLLRYLGPREVLNLNNISEITKMKQALVERLAGCFVYVDPGGETFLSGKDYQAVKEYQENQAKTGTDIDIRGSIANGGRAIGRVSVCKNIDDLDKVQPGDILVASMTRPEYVQALKKAAGVVTDEGGITCHAAIVARELGIPAVIGTKIATRVLKDGMIVEVRANHGLVRIIKE